MSEKVDKFLYKVTLKIQERKDIFTITYYVIARNSAIAIKLCIDMHDYSAYCKYDIKSIDIECISSTSHGLDKLLIE